jgi:LmbE family N-acetylglucosaminyl deacetylase
MQPIRPILNTTLLGVWAHPDDESYLSAALMNRVVRAGGRVVVVTATRGERGGSGDPRALAVTRERELREAMSVLGVDDIRFLGYSDGGCADADASEATNTIAALIDDLHPDVIVTFGPDGITHHPDHAAVSRWTTAAAGAAGHDEVLYATLTDEFSNRFDDLHARIGLWADGAPLAIPASELALRVTPTRRERAVKARALRAHASQMSGLIEMIGEDVFDSWWVEEFYRRPTASEWSAASSVRAASWPA